MNKNLINVNGKIYERVNGKFRKVDELSTVVFNGKTYKKIYDPIGSDPKENCLKHCIFSERDEEGEPCCGAADKDSRFWGCSAGFHWEDA